MVFRAMSLLSLVEYVHPIMLYLAPIVPVAFFLLRKLFYKKPIFVFSSLAYINSFGLKESFWQKYFLLILRFLVLFFICLALSRPRIADLNSKINNEGIDIMMLLDVSGSMHDPADYFSYDSRIDVAKREAAKFVENRIHDALGVVIFGADILTRCPLTWDKKIVVDIIKGINLGDIDPSGTALYSGLLAAINRLKTSKSKNKIIIALTDGNPTESPEIKDIAIDLAKKLDIKIYTIGIGSNELNNNMFGFTRPQNSLNEILLREISEPTGGRLFIAKNANEISQIYSTIDSLEKSEQQIPEYAKYFEYFTYFLWLAIFLFFLELLFSTFWWFSL